MQPLLNKPGLEAMREDQRVADFICALRGTQRGDLKVGWQLEVASRDRNDFGKAQGAEKRARLAVKASIKASISKGRRRRSLQASKAAMSDRFKGSHDVREARV